MKKSILKEAILKVLKNDLNEALNLNLKDILKQDTHSSKAGHYASTYIDAGNIKNSLDLATFLKNNLPLLGDGKIYGSNCTFGVYDIQIAAQKGQIELFADRPQPTLKDCFDYIKTKRIRERDVPIFRYMSKVNGVDCIVNLEVYKPVKGRFEIILYFKTEPQSYDYVDGKYVYNVEKSKNKNNRFEFYKTHKFSVKDITGASEVFCTKIL